MTLQSMPAPAAFVVLAKPAPVYPALLVSIVPSTPQKPVTFSWSRTVIPPVEVEVVVEELEDELDELDELVVEPVELEVLEDEKPPVPDVELLEDVLLVDELLLEEDELLELEELDELLLVTPPLPAQAGV